MPAASSSRSRRSVGLAEMIEPTLPWLTSAGECAPVAASANSSETSLARTSLPSIRYAEPAPRSMRRVTSLSPSAPSASPTRSRRIETSAKSRGGRRAVPAKITSSMPPPRSDFGLPSPITQRMASRRLDLPHPFGPTTPVSPGSIRSSDGSTKLLKPLSFRRRMRKLYSPTLTGALAPDCFAQLGLQRFPGRRLLEQFAVENERRRAGEFGILRRDVAIDLHELVDLVLVGKARAALAGGNAALRRPLLQAGQPRELDELPLRPHRLQRLEVLLRHLLQLGAPIALVG